MSLLLLIGAVYWQALRAPFVFDDVPNLQNNPALTSGSGVVLISGGTGDAGDTLSGRPVTVLAFMLDRRLFGAEPWTLRFVNLVLHAMGAVMVFGVTRRLLERMSEPFWRNSAMGAAWCVAALWALHPLQTAAVTYIVQRAEILASLGVLACIHAFLRGLDTPKRRTQWWTISVLSAWVGMAAKETAVVAPLAVWLVDRGTATAGWLAAIHQRKWLYGGLAAGWLFLATLVLTTGGRGGTAGFDAGVGVWEYVLTQSGAILRYAQLIFWPHPLIFDYGTAVVSGVAEVWWQLPCVLAAVGLVAVGLLRGKPAALLGAWFFLLLAPSSSFVPVASQTMAEHRLYLALVAPVLATTLLLWQFVGRKAWWFVIPVLGLCAVVTMARNQDYLSARSLWADTVAKRPDNTRARINLALALLAEGQSQAAQMQLERAVQLDPRSADAQFNLGVVHAKMRRMQEAAAAYSQAVKLRPGFAAAHLEFSILNLEMGAVALALKHAQQAAFYAPNSAAAAYQLGNALLAAGNVPEARRSFDRTVSLDPEHADARVNLGNLLAEAGEFNRALEQYERALQSAPGSLSAHRNSGAVCAHLGRLEQAIRHYEAAVRLDPSDVRLREELQQLLAAYRR